MTDELYDNADSARVRERPAKKTKHLNKQEKKEAHRRKKRQLITRTAIITALVTCLITTAVLGIFCGSGPMAQLRSVFFHGTDSAEDAESTLKDLLQSEPTLTALREVYTDDLVFHDPEYTNRYRFVAIDRSLPQNDYDISNLVILDSGEYQYTQDDQVVSHKGIDVSSHQGEIDWDAVKNDGVEFVYIRAGFRGYGSGKLVEDENFKANIAGAKAAGIPYGVYFFTQATTEDEAREEADYVISLLGSDIPDLPVMCDVELVKTDDARGDTLTADERTAVVSAFLSRIQEQGLTPAIYLNLDMGGLHLNISQFTGYDIWYANYTTDFYWPYQYKYWQYSCTGTVAGIDGEVDMDLMMY